MRTMSILWAKEFKNLDKPQDEPPNDLISRSGRIRKVKDVSSNYLVGKDKVTTVRATTTKLKNSEKVETESVKMEREVAPMTTVSETPKRETVKDNKSRVDADLLQKVLSESVEEWFSFTEEIKVNKGKPYKKRKILLPPIDESDFNFELTETQDTVKDSKNGGKRIDLELDKNLEKSLSEEIEKEDIALANNKNEKVNYAVITKGCKTERPFSKVVKKELDKRFDNDKTEMIRENLKTDVKYENEKTTENGKNKNLTKFLAPNPYGDQTVGVTTTQMTTTNSSREKLRNLNTTDRKEFKVGWRDLYRPPSGSPIFKCVNDIERFLQTGRSRGILRKSLSSECLNVFPESYNDRPERSAEMPATLPSRQNKTDPKVRECFLLLRKDIIDKYKREANCRIKQEVKKLREKRNKEVQPEEKKKGCGEKAKNQERTEGSKENTGEQVERKGKPKTNGRWKTNGSEKMEMKVVTNVTYTKTTKVVMKNQIDSENDNKMSGMRLKKRKRVRTKDKFFSYVNKIKRKSGYKSSSESAESQNVLNEDPVLKPVKSTRETRVCNEKETEIKQEVGVEEKSEETKERRKSQREIKLTPKLVHMIATSYKRAKKSPSIREDSVEDVDYEYSNLLKKVVSGTVTPEVVDSPPSASAIENYLQSKMEANASNFQTSWKPGDLVWARFAGSPFWPSLILRDPFSDDEYTKVKYLGRLLKTFVHLQFLADSGRRAWVPELYCMTFNGLEEFEKMKANLPKIDSFTKRNDIVYQKAFFPTKKVEKAWLDAVKEGETLLTKSKDERITYMKIKYPLVKYATSVSNGQLVSNGRSSGESNKSQSSTRKRKTKTSSWAESSNLFDNEKAATAEEASTKTNETFECVRPTTAENNKNGDDKESPKITLKLVRSPKKEEKISWSKSSECIDGQLTKRPKTEVKDADCVSRSKVSSRSLKAVKSLKGGMCEEVCQVCLRMVENKKITKCKGICSGVFPKSCWKGMGAELPSLEDGMAPALKKTKRRRKFSSPPVNTWKQKLWTVLDFYKEFGGCKRKGMDMRGLCALYRSLCKNKTGNKRPKIRIDQHKMK